ncbi:MAG: TonB-dependent receptor [Bacteroidetes bacterium]|nr:MAG: TonB-dependent receptor [Bacteroidota bacterium]
MKQYLALCVAVLLMGHILAQDTTNTLDPVTITAGIQPILASQTGRNMLVLDGRQFDKLPVNSLDELLRYVPGIEVQARGPMGAQSDIIIRGGTFQQVLIILDGIKLNDPLTGHFNSYIPIAPAEIDRIEVLKGAASAIYGTEAVGGVVHIITKSFGRTTKKHTANAQVMAGEYGLLNVQAGGTYAGPKSMISAGVLSNHATGQPQRGTRGFFDLTTASASWSTALNTKWTLAARLAYDRRSFAAQNFYTSFASDTATETVKTWWNHAQASYKTNKLNWQTSVGYKAVDDNYKFNRALTPNQNNSSVLQMLSTLDVKWGKTGTLTVGGQYVQKEIQSNDRGNHAVWQNGIFAIWHQQVGKLLYINPALRFDYNSRSGGQWVPQLNVAYHLKPVQLRGSVGRTIRDADFTERFNNYNRTGLRSGSIGNPDLTAETAWNWELGADWRLGNAFKLATTFFERQQRNLIDFVTTPYANMPRQQNLVPGGLYALASNIGAVQSRGLEADLQWHKLFGNGHSLQANLGLLWLKSQLPSGKEPGFYISSHARFLTNWSVVYKYKWLIMSLNGVYKTRAERAATSPLILPVSPRYMVANARVETRIKTKIGLFLQVDNVGNVRYSDILGSVMPRRWAMAGLKWGF